MGKTKVCIYNKSQYPRASSSSLIFQQPYTFDNNSNNIPLIYPLNRWRNCGMERSSNFPEVPWLMSIWVWTLTQFLWPPNNSEDCSLNCCTSLKPLWVSDFALVEEWDMESETLHHWPLMSSCKPPLPLRHLCGTQGKQETAWEPLGWKTSLTSMFSL